MINYFSNLFQGTLGSLSPVLDNFAKKLSHAQNVGLVKSFTIEEIKMALFDMKSEKSLGLDGLLPGFFQHYWDIVARDVLQFCENFRLSKVLSTGANHTHIVLIPKVSKPESIELNHSLMIRYSELSACLYPVD